MRKKSTQTVLLRLNDGVTESSIKPLKNIIVNIVFLWSLRTQNERLQETPSRIIANWKFATNLQNTLLNAQVVEIQREKPL